MTSELHASPVRRRGRLLFVPGEQFKEEILRPLMSPEAYSKRKLLLLGSAAMSADPECGPDEPIRRAVGTRMPVSWQTPGSRIGIRSVTHEFDQASSEDPLSEFMYARVFYRFHLSPQHSKSLEELAYIPNARLPREAARHHNLRVRTLGFTVLSRGLPEQIKTVGHVDEQERHINERLATHLSSVPTYYYVNSRPEVIELT